MPIGGIWGIEEECINNPKIKKVFTRFRTTCNLKGDEGGRVKGKGLG